MEKCCGTCEYHEYENLLQEWVCVNDKSEYVADWTYWTHCCEEWEARK